MFLVDTKRIFRNSPYTKLLFLPMELYREVVSVRKILKLDFDDAYQYSIAKYHGLKVVTMDKDFERIKDVETLFL
ncbi:PIN domain-containing protein [Petrotoga mobilis]|nr:PIN domain-containing protein [Petrotoga mobilis]